MTSDSLYEILVCPICRAQLEFSPATVTCKKCNHEYPLHDGVPILFTPDSPFYDSQNAILQARGPNAHISWPQRLLRPLLQWNPPLTTWIDRSLFRYLNECTPEMRILNLGSGVGLFDKELGSHLKMINLDVCLRDNVDLLADGHKLPFADESFDAVYSNAVLEHVRRPWLVAEEIHRILRPGGKVFINVPFLNIIHDTHDYFRFTDHGLEVLFSAFKKIDGGVSAGPSSFLGPFLVEYLLCFLPGRFLKVLIRPISNLAVWPLKYLDFLIRSSSSLRLTADAFYYVGIK